MKNLLCLSVLTFFFTCPASAAMIDLTDYGTSGNINNALFVQYTAARCTEPMDTFLQIRNSRTQSGYNTDGPVEFDTISGTYTHALALEDVPIVYLPGSEFGYYREFLLDINQSSPNAILSLDSLEVYVEPIADITDYESDPFTNLIYDLDFGNDSWIRLDADLNAGSGKGDMLLYIPSQLFGTECTAYVYLYADFGLMESCDDGFEQWAIRTDGEGVVPVPLPSTLYLLLSSLLALSAGVRRKNYF